MELIEFAEKRGEEAAKFSLATLELARARAHNLLVLLLGGAGSLAALALAQENTHPRLTVFAVTVALCWFGLAAWLAVRGLRTSPVRTWAGEGKRILRKGAEWQRYVDDVVAEGGLPQDALLLLRKQELELMADASEEYRAASTQCATALDHAYVFAALTPYPALLLVGVYQLLG